MNHSSEGPLIMLGRIDFRDDRRVFGIKQADRRAHLYIIGKTGTGKSTLLETLVRQDLAAGRGLALLDPHGDLVERVLAASGVLEVFKKLWADSWGPRLEHILRNALLALFDQPQSTLADVLRLLTDLTFRKSAALRITNRQVYEFWFKEYEKYPTNF